MPRGIEQFIKRHVIELHSISAVHGTVPTAQLISQPSHGRGVEFIDLLNHDAMRSEH